MRALTESVPVSRPKIHRLPVVPPVSRPPRNFPKRKHLLAGGGVALAVLILIVASSGRLFSGAPPQLGQSQADTGVATQSPEKTIVLRNENQVIIGQMAHISSPATPPPEVRTMSAGADARRGQELLSIINQY